MRVIDSSAWIEWLIDSPVGNALARHIPSPSETLVPTIVQFELWRWLVRERGEEDADRLIAYTMKCSVISLDATLALQAAETSAHFRLAMADAIVYATALQHGATLVTCDDHFRDLPGVILIGKSSK